MKDNGLVLPQTKRAIASFLTHHFPLRLSYTVQFNRVTANLAQLFSTLQDDVTSVFAQRGWDWKWLISSWIYWTVTYILKNKEMAMLEIFHFCCYWRSGKLCMRLVCLFLALKAACMVRKLLLPPGFDDSSCILVCCNHWMCMCEKIGTGINIKDRQVDNMQEQ